MSADEPVSDLTSHLGYWLRLVSNHVSHTFARALDDEAVTVAEWAVMRSLYGQGAVAPSRLADRMGLTRGAISKLADRLAAKGLVERQDNADDGRAHTLRLTAAGQGLTPKLAAVADRNDAAFFAPLDADDRADLQRILKALADRHGLKATPVS